MRRPGLAATRSRVFEELPVGEKLSCSASRRAVAAVTCVVLWSTPISPGALAQSSTDASESASTTLRGTIASAVTGRPVEGARVVHLETRNGTVTDSVGEFTLRRLPAGPSTIRVVALGFGSNDVRLRLREGAITEALFLFSPDALVLEDLHVTVPPETTPKLREFHMRKKTGFGYYFTPDEIEELNPELPSDLLRRVPGVTVGAQHLGQSEVRMSKGSLGGGLDCPPMLYVDGFHHPGLRFDDLTTDDILALEIYRGASETPPRFKRRASYCGVIVVWTRDGSRRPTP